MLQCYFQKSGSVSELVFPTRRGSVKAEEVDMMGGSELKLHEFKGGVGEGEGGVEGDRKVVSVDHCQSTTTRGTWKGPQLVSRRSQVDTLTLVAVSFHPRLCQKQYVNTSFTNSTISVRFSLGPTDWAMKTETESPLSF